MAERAPHKKTNNKASKRSKKGGVFRKREEEIEDAQELKTYWVQLGVYNRACSTCFSPCFDASLAAIPYYSS